MSERGLAFVKKVSQDPAFEDAICFRSPAELYNHGDEDKELDTHLDAFIKNCMTSNNATMVSWAQEQLFMNKRSYATRHKLIRPLRFRGEVDIDDKALKVMPAWWNQEFPHTLNNATKAIYDAIDYEAFDGGVVPNNVWKKVRESLPSPMDKRVFAQARVGSILEKLVEFGVANKTLLSKWKDRVKARGGKAKISISDLPLDFLRVSRGLIKSCISPGGGYEHALTGLLNDPLGMVIIQDQQDKEIGGLDSTSHRMFFHLMADYAISGDENHVGCDFKSWMDSFLRAVYLGQQNSFNKYTSVKANNWYLVVDRLYGPTTDAIYPFLYILWELANKNGLKLAVPDAYNFTQREVNIKLNTNTIKSQKKTVYAPIAYREGWGTYQDNLVALYDYTMLGEKVVPINNMYGNRRGDHLTASYLMSFEKKVLVLENKEDIASISVG